MKKNWNQKILALAAKAGRKGLAFHEIKKICKSKSKEIAALRETLSCLLSDGKLLLYKNRYFSPKALNVYPAIIAKNSRTFCFARRLSDDEQIFIPGKYTRGAMADDLVFIRPQRQLGESEEGQVVSIYRQGPSLFTGVFLQEEDHFYVLPDSLSKDRIPVRNPRKISANPGDKVIAKVVFRGSRHSEHICELVSSHGNSETAAACAETILESNGISFEFPAEVLDNAERIQRKGISETERSRRLDLTGLPIFTIDSADSKDLDDAISIEKGEHCYYVGVHIADVSHYVKHRSPLDQEAMARGTSIYYADKVIPMLPPALSNGICSLNPQEERLAFSALMNVGFDGKLQEYTFKKTIIRSRVKGVYSEINQLLDGTAQPDIQEKYRELFPSLQLMFELYQVLHRNKIKRGAPQLVTRESKIYTDKSGKTVDIQPRNQGVAEGMIEEFMLLANEAAASLAKKLELPFVYRVHERPSPEKIASLKEILDRLGLPTNKLDPKMKPAVLARILEQSQGTELFPIVNTQILRSMAKAKYSEFPIGHYGLALDNYAHFTSPIRRYPDLVVHRILTEMVSYQEPPSRIQKQFGKFAAQAARQSTACEVTAMQIERSCEDCYKAEYMKQNVGKSYQGIITSVLGRGIYVELENTVEGYVPIESMNGEYLFDGYTQLRNPLTGTSYRVGQTVNVLCTAANVNAGTIDFNLIDPAKQND